VALEHDRGKQGGTTGVALSSQQGRGRFLF
jgi:hypothetical protein